MPSEAENNNVSSSNVLSYEQQQLVNDYLASLEKLHKKENSLEKKKLFVNLCYVGFLIGTAVIFAVGVPGGGAVTLGVGAGPVATGVALGASVVHLIIDTAIDTWSHAAKSKLTILKQEIKNQKKQLEDLKINIPVVEHKEAWYYTANKIIGTVREVISGIINIVKGKLYTNEKNDNLNEDRSKDKAKTKPLAKTHSSSDLRKLISASKDKETNDLIISNNELQKSDITEKDKKPKAKPKPSKEALWVEKQGIVSKAATQPSSTNSSLDQQETQKRKKNQGSQKIPIEKEATEGQKPSGSVRRAGQLTAALKQLGGKKNKPRPKISDTTFLERPSQETTTRSK